MTTCLVRRDYMDFKDAVEVWSVKRKEWANGEIMKVEKFPALSYEEFYSLLILASYSKPMKS